jgi:hypothetical protein
VLRQRLSAPRTLHAPHHLDVEVASTVRGLAAGKKITDHRGEQMLPDYARLSQNSLMDAGLAFRVRYAAPRHLAGPRLVPERSHRLISRGRPVRG